MWPSITNLWTALTRFVDCVSQKVLGWFGRDRRSRKVAAEHQIVSQAKPKLALLCQTEYATSAQADIALQGYRTLYQQITLPEVRQELLAPAGLNIVLMGGAWRIMDQMAARKVRAVHALGKAGRQHKRRADARLACAAR